MLKQLGHSGQHQTRTKGTNFTIKSDVIKNTRRCQKCLVGRLSRVSEGRNIKHSTRKVVIKRGHSGGGDLRSIEKAVIFVENNFMGQFSYLKIIAHRYFAGIQNSLTIN